MNCTKDPKITITFCPSCHQETFEVEVENSGSGFNGEYTQFRAEGNGKCIECGYEGFWCDSN